MNEIDEFLTLKLKLFRTVLIFFGLMAFIMSVTRFYEQAYAQFLVDMALNLGKKLKTVRDWGSI